MSKKRAFVRYSKQGKIVPGSLILTAGSHPNGPSTWKEVPADLCCDNSGGLSNVIVTTTLPEYPIIIIYFNLQGCGLNFNISGYPLINNPLITGQAVADFCNASYPFLGNFTFTAPNIISLQLSSNLIFAEFCNNPAVWTLNIDNAA